MKSLKTLLTAAVLGLAVLPALSYAQPPAGGGGPGGPGGGGRRGQTPEQQIARLEEAVGTLTAEQKTKITAIYTKAATDRAALAPEDRRGQKGQDMTAATNKEIRALLTPDQQKKFDAMPPMGRGPGGPGGPGGGAGGPPKQ